MIDPSGNIAFLKEWQEGLQANRDFIISYGESLSNQYLQGNAASVVRGAAAKYAGAQAGLNSFLANAVGTVNWVANTSVAVLAPALGQEDSDFYRQAGAEVDEALVGLRQTVEGAKKAAGFALEHPGQTSLRLLEAGKDRAVGLFTNDFRTVAETEAFKTQLALDIVVGGKGAESVGKLGRRLAGEVDDVARSLARSAERRLAQVTERLPLRWSEEPGSNFGNIRLRRPRAPSGAADAAARRAYLNQKFGRTGNLQADISRGSGYSQGLAARTGYANTPGYRLMGRPGARRWFRVDAVDDLPKHSRYLERLGNPERHHPFPQYLGGPRDQPLTALRRLYHQDLHREMYRYLDPLGMAPRAGYTGADIRGAFSLPERLDALAGFYRGPGARFGGAAEEFFARHYR